MDDLITQLGLGAVKATGSITLTDLPDDGDEVTIASQSFEFDDEADKATGTIALGGVPADGDTITIGDGAKTDVFEFDRGMKATGQIMVTGVPADGDTVTIKDSTQAASTFEFDNGVLATGGISLSDQPADGNFLTINDGVNTPSAFEFDLGVKATGSLAIGTNPAGGKTLTISDGVHSATVFEFYTEGEVAEGHVGVLIGATKEDTMAALVTAINGVTTTLTVTATAAGTPDHTCTLANDNYTHVGNVNITTTAADIAIVGMAGGAVAGSGAVTEGRTAVAIGASKEATMVNLINAINGTGESLKVAAAPAVPADATCTLTCEIRNANGAISRTGANITVTGMTGGKAPGAGPVTGGNIAVAVGASAAASAANLLTAINNVGAGLLVTASPTDPASGTITLEADALGAAENIAITKTGNSMTVIGMRDGADAGSGIVGAGHIPVAAVTSATATMAALVVAINSVAAGLALTATAAQVPDHTCALENDASGSAGNVVITKSCSVATVTGMSGGNSVGDNVSQGAIGVAIGADLAACGANLRAAIAASGLVNIAAGAQPPATIGLEALAAGDAGNGAITKTGDAITVTGMAGGHDRVDLRDVIADIHRIADNTDTH
ncbi:hypothetical protein UFOVP141_3 [uncultured Caudovirales phage]|uniref:Uncharacterized protein n=1 Tax=uncultured Caudovirales phage TaxID=2100421 RepID=A0A6J7VL40_9CAUD|nr:hypothetical protein UFOVP141_3 [uncultured Caudovirales phage]